MAPSTPRAQQGSGKAGPTDQQKRQQIALHELFLTTQVADEDLQRSLRIFRGYCNMNPVSFIRRRLIWTGPHDRRATNTRSVIDPNFIARQQRPDKARQWTILNEHLKRQPYVVHLLYDMGREDFGERPGTGGLGIDLPGAKTMDCDDMYGTLRWSDQPEPGNREVNVRAIVQIDQERHLCKVMETMSMRFKSEVIQECYRFVHGNVTFELSRLLQLPPDGGNEMLPAFRSTMPVFEDLIPFDGENKWILSAYAIVQNGADQETTKIAMDELTKCKRDFEGCFDLQVVDRHVLDTRVRA